MSNKRIDLTQFEEMDVNSMPIWYSKIPDLVAELKRCYETIDGFEETVDHLEVAEDVLGRSGWSDVYSQELEKRLYE